MPRDGRQGLDVGADLTSRPLPWSDGSPQGIAQTIERGVPQPKAHCRGDAADGGVPLSPADVAAVADFVWALGHRGTQTSTR